MDHIEFTTTTKIPLSLIIDYDFLKRDEKLVLKLAKLVPSQQEDLLNMVLRLLLNLSFDSEIRFQMIKSGYLPKLVGLLSN